MKTDPLVTVLMTVFNGGNYLKFSIKSILAQTYRDFEFLIINDCSTDNSMETISSFNDPRIIVYTNPINMGQTKSLNVGLKLAKGKYIARMDADDMAFPLWLEKLVNYIKEHPEYASVGTSAVVIDSSGTPKRLHKTPTNFQEIIVNLFFGRAMNHVGTILNKKLIIENGGYNENFSISQDYELWSSLIRNNYLITNIPDVLVSVRVHENSLGFMEESKKSLTEVAEVIVRTVNSLTDLKTSHDEAVRMRLFYRFPEQLTIEEFKGVQNMYAKIFDSLKDKFKLEPRLIKMRLRGLMLRPFCIRAVHEIKNDKPRIAREVVMSFNRKYGFHIMPFLIFMITFAGFGISKRIPFIYEKWLEITTKLFLKIRFT